MVLMEVRARMLFPTNQSPPVESRRRNLHVAGLRVDWSRKAAGGDWPGRGRVGLHTAGF